MSDEAPDTNEAAISIHLVMKGEKWQLLQDWAENLVDMCGAHEVALAQGEAPVWKWNGSVHQPDEVSEIVMMTAADIECEVEVCGDGIWQITRIDYKEDLG